MDPSAPTPLFDCRKTRGRGLTKRPPEFPLGLADSLPQCKAPGLFDMLGFIMFRFENVPFTTIFALLNNAKLL